MTIRTLSLQEIQGIAGGGKFLAAAVRGCFNGGMAGMSAAPDGSKWLGAGAGCLAGASVGMAGGGSEAQTAAGAAAGLAFGDGGSRYAGSSNNPSAPNYENSMDRQDSQRRMSFR